MNTKDLFNKKLKKFQPGGTYDVQQYSPYSAFPGGDFQYRPNVEALNAQPIGIQPTQPLMPSASLYPAQAPDANIQYRDNVQNQIYNPYTGINLETALFNLGRSINYNGENKTANAVSGAASAGKILFGGARTLLSGAGYQNRTDNTYNSFMDNLYNPQVSYVMQEGGEITNANALTGAYVIPSPEGQGNVEIENNEIVKDGVSGDILKAKGDTHENGGIETNLSDGSKVLSDYTRIGAKNAQQFRKELDLKGIKATDTFSKVMDKYNKKIGWTDLIETEEKTIDKIATQQTSDVDDTTRDLNLNFLSEKLQQIQTDKEAVKPLQDDTFEMIFSEQEKIPKKGNKDEKMQEGGQFDPNVLALAEQYNLSPEKVLELLQRQNPVQQETSQGVSQEEILQQLINSGMSPEQAQQTLQSQQPIMQGGGQFFTPSPFAQNSYGYQPYINGTTNAAGIQDEANVLARLQLQNQNLPYIVRQSGIYSDNAGAFPNLNNTGAFQQGYDRYVNTLVSEIPQNPYLTEEQRTKYIDQAKSQLLGISNKNGQYDNIYGQETSSRTGFSLPYLSEADRQKYQDIKFIGDVIDENGKIKADYAELSPEAQDLILSTYNRGKENSLNIGLGVVPQQETTSSPATVEAVSTNPTVIDRNITNYTNAQFPVDFILPPSAAQPVFKASATLSQIDPIKISAEPNLVELSRQSQSATQALNSLPDSQRAATIASLLGQTQSAGNQAISNAEQVNAQVANQAQIYNAQVADKQQLLDNQFAQTYEGNAFAAQRNSEIDLRNYFNNLNQIQRQNFADVRDLNLLNQAFPNYQTNGQTVSFNNTPLNFQTNSNSTYSRMTPEQKRVYEKEIAKRLAQSKFKK